MTNKLESGIDSTFETLTSNDLLNTIPEWTTLGYGLCALVKLAVIKVKNKIMKIFFECTHLKLKYVCDIYLKEAKICD